MEEGKSLNPEHEACPNCGGWKGKNWNPAECHLGHNFTDPRIKIDMKAICRNCHCPRTEHYARGTAEGIKGVCGIGGLEWSAPHPTSTEGKDL
jgi:hypothetical protein